MIEAPVGYRCPDCMKVNAPPAPKTVAGGALVSTPRVTYFLIGINVFLFAVQYAQGINKVAVDYGMFPIAISQGGEWWRLFTSAFLHGSFIHIAFNMYVLFFLGPTLERILGHTRFIVLYLLSAIGGSVASYWFSDLQTVSVGASGAIFGLMGALIVAGRRLRYDIKQVLFLLAVNVAIGFFSPGVDWRAHFGGLVVGAAVAAVMVFPPKRIRMQVQITGVVGLILILVALTMLRTNQINELFTPITQLVV
jgi:membrane associated rhomboid family serine protease